MSALRAEAMSILGAETVERLERRRANRARLFDRRRTGIAGTSLDNYVPEPSRHVDRLSSSHSGEREDAAVELAASWNEIPSEVDEREGVYPDVDDGEMSPSAIAAIVGLTERHVRRLVSRFRRDVLVKLAPLAKDHGVSDDAIARTIRRARR